MHDNCSITLLAAKWTRRGVAQMVERLLRMHEAGGSIPPTSIHFFGRFLYYMRFKPVAILFVNENGVPLWECGSEKGNRRGWAVGKPIKHRAEKIGSGWGVL